MHAQLGMNANTGKLQKTHLHTTAAVLSCAPAAAWAPASASAPSAAWAPASAPAHFVLASLFFALHGKVKHHGLLSGNFEHTCWE
jgi:hypothetical protein